MQYLELQTFQGRTNTANHLRNNMNLSWQIQSENFSQNYQAFFGVESNKNYGYIRYILFGS